MWDSTAMGQRTPENDPSVRLLWPELAPESVDRIDNESAAIAERRAKVFRLYTSGKTIREVAEAVNTASKSTVARDVQHVLDSYRLIALQDAAALVAAELAKLAAIEAEAWESFEKSKQAGEETEATRNRRGGMTLSKVKRRGRDGDPRWLELALNCHDRRCALLKLHKIEGDSNGDVGEYIAGVMARRGAAVPGEN